MEQASRSQWSVWITRVVGLWILAGATLKLIWGNETQLPRIVLQLPLEPELTFRLAVAAEICIGLLALLRPRWSWLLVIALLVLFDVALVTQILEGQESCGCFGTKFPVSPWVMLAIDSVLLLLVLLSRPWAAPGSDATGGIIAVVVVVGAALLPWALDREVAGPQEAETALLPAEVRLRVDTWEGKALAETGLAPWVDLEALPDSGLWILYRDSCPVCAALFEYLGPMEDGRRELVLVRMPDEAGAPTKEVHVRPEGPWVHAVTLAPVDWIFTAPGAIWVEDGRVVRAVEGIEGVEGFLAEDQR